MQQETAGLTDQGLQNSELNRPRQPDALERRVDDLVGIRRALRSGVERTIRSDDWTNAYEF